MIDLSKDPPRVREQKPTAPLYS